MRLEGNGAEFVKHPDVRPPISRAREAQLRQHLEGILVSPGFQGASRRARLLRYLVEELLEGRGDSLKEPVIAMEVFERAPDYDPQVDSVVRVEVGRLRSRLAEYYGQTGREGPVQIDIPKGGYRPVFVFRDPSPEPPIEPPATAPAEPAPTHSFWRKWKPIAACAAGIAALAAAFWLMRGPEIPRSIAVLPFLNLSGDPASEYLGDGISEEVTEALAQSPDLRVVSRTSAFQYKGKPADVRELGRKLGARAVLEGSVGRRGDQLHVVAQLIRASDGYHLWSEAYDSEPAELPSVEARIGQAVRQKLSPAASVAAASVREPAVTKVAEAHDLYLRAAYQLNLRTLASTQRTLELARQAADRDPSYAQPYVLMASAESQLSTLFAKSPRAASEEAREYIAKALQLDPANSGAHALLAMLTYIDQWDWPRAEHEFRLALASGSHGSAENIYGWCLMTRGRFTESRRHLAIAAELDPLSLGPQLNQVEELMAEGLDREASRKANQILENGPSNFIALALAASAALRLRDCSATVAVNQKLLALYPQSPYAHLSALASDAFCGHRERVAGEFAEILSGHPPGYLSPFSVATAYALAGDADHTFAYLQKSADLREPTLLMLRVERVFDKVRQDPRIVALERQIGLLD